MSYHTIQLIFEILALGEINQLINSLIDCLDMVCEVLGSLKLNANLPDIASKTKIIISIFKEHFMTPLTHLLDLFLSIIHLSTSAFTIYPGDQAEKKTKYS